MDNTASSSKRKGANIHEQDSSTIVANKHKTIDESNIKAFAANGIVSPFNSRNKVEKNNSKAKIENPNANTDSLLEVKECRKTDIDQVQLLISLESLNWKEISHNSGQILKAATFASGTCKLISTEERNITGNPIKADCKCESIGIETKFHGPKEQIPPAALKSPNVEVAGKNTSKNIESELTTKKEKHVSWNLKTSVCEFDSFGKKTMYHGMIQPAAVKEHKVDITLNNTSIFPKPETDPVKTKYSFRYCRPNCKRAHKKIMREKKKEHNSSGITLQERCIIMRSCLNRIKEGDMESARALSEILLAYPVSVDFQLTEEKLNSAPSTKLQRPNIP